MTSRPTSLGRWMKSCCDVCLIPHDAETHEATLRIHQSLFLPGNREIVKGPRAVAEESPACRDCGAPLLVMTRMIVRCLPCQQRHDTAGREEAHQRLLARRRARAAQARAEALVEVQV